MLGHLSALMVGFVLDLIIGDPPNFWHPVKAIGSLIFALTKVLRNVFPSTKQGQIAAGVLLVGVVIALPVVLLGGVFWLLIHYNLTVFAWLLEVIVCYQLLATKCLRSESMKVYDCLEKNDLPQARYALSMIVGRDTDNLGKKSVARAAVETVAENFNDGVFAPLFYMAIGGPIAGLVYKSVNTMDSMVGYKNDEFVYFGRAAALLDDVLNWPTARLAGMVMSASAYFSGLDAQRAWNIFLRDRLNHASPNSAHTEAACAGALHVRLGGSSTYRGVVKEKPFIGDALKEIEHEDIVRANRLMVTSSIGSLVVLVLVVGFIDLGVTAVNGLVLYVV